MKRKNLLMILIVLVITAMLITPVGLLYYLSVQEQAQYTIPAQEVITLTERSYGIPEVVMRQDVAEKIFLSGNVISTDVIYQELEPEISTKLRLLISVGQYLQVGDRIGYCEGEEVLASESGVVRSISLHGTAPYIELWDMEKLAIECYVTDTQLRVLQRSSLELSDAEGNPYEVLRINDIPSSNGLTKVLLTSESAALIYGSSMSDFGLNTGRIYPGSLVVPSSCVFSTDGGVTHYVRLVNADGTIIGNAQVEIGYSIGSRLCISGVEEGQYCDPGYKAVVEG